MSDTIYKLNQIAVEALKDNESIYLKAFGNSMLPKIKSGSISLLEKVTMDTSLEKGDIVFCKVNGRFYLHLISAVKDNQFQISNNSNNVNGWTGKNNIYAKYISPK